MILRVVDLETTGVPTEDDPQAVCEVGWTDVYEVMGEWIVGPTTAMITNPQRRMPAEALAVHHITDAMTAEGCAIDVAFRQMNDPAPDIYVSHNADFEKQFFGPNFKWICTLKAAYRIWPDAPRHSNQVLRYMLDLPVDPVAAMPPHRAGPDTHVTAHLIAHILRNRLAEVDDMARWSKGPALLPKINFGKHKGAKWEDAPSDYLRWIVDKSDMDRDVKANARHHLKLREAGR